MKSVAIRVHLWLKVLTLKNPVTTIFNSISFRINTNVHHPHFPGVEYGRMVLTRPTSSTPPPHHTRVQPVPPADFPENSKICRNQPTGPMKTKDFTTNENPKITQNNPPRGSAMPFRGLELTPKATAGGFPSVQIGVHLRLRVLTFPPSRAPPRKADCSHLTLKPLSCATLSLN